MTSTAIDIFLCLAQVESYNKRSTATHIFTHGDLRDRPPAPPRRAAVTHIFFIVRHSFLISSVFSRLFESTDSKGVNNVLTQD